MEQFSAAQLHYRIRRELSNARSQTGTLQTTLVPVCDSRSSQQMNHPIRLAATSSQPFLGHSNSTSRDPNDQSRAAPKANWLFEKSARR